MKLLIKFPTRDRKDKFFEVLDMYVRMLLKPDDVHFLISCDEDDETMNNDEVKSKLATYKNLTIGYGKNSSKIEACNADMGGVDFDIVLLASDDMIPKAFGFDENIRKNMVRLYPDTDGVLWYNDGFQGPRLNTLCILGKKYYDRFGYIYHPSYKSLWCDNEFMIVANTLEKQTYINAIIVEHQHMDRGMADQDELYIKNNKLNVVDYNNFIKRKEINFELNG